MMSFTLKLVSGTRHRHRQASRGQGFLLLRSQRAFTVASLDDGLTWRPGLGVGLPASLSPAPSRPQRLVSQPRLYLVIENSCFCLHVWDLGFQHESEWPACADTERAVFPGPVATPARAWCFHPFLACLPFLIMLWLS